MADDFDPMNNPIDKLNNEKKYDEAVALATKLLETKRSDAWKSKHPWTSWTRWTLWTGILDTCRFCNFFIAPRKQTCYADLWIRVS